MQSRWIFTRSAGLLAGGLLMGSASKVFAAGKVDLG